MIVVVGMSGASGAIYGIRLLEVLRDCGCTTHLVTTPSARRIIEIETKWNVKDVELLATFCHQPQDFTAPIASGSFLFDSMVVAPCSMKTLAGVACGISDTLITRCADICLKERRKVILLSRESPLNLVHLRNMVAASEAGAIVMPACPPFYTRPQSIKDMTDAVVGRVLDLLGVKHGISRRWGDADLERKLL